MRRIACLVWMVTMVLGIPILRAADADAHLTGGRKTVWSGVYTAKQATRGAAVYMNACSQCHREDLSGYSGLRGTKFMDNWREDNLSSLWLRISKTMPMGAPGTLSEAQYLDVLAYLLQANDFPPGAEELNTKTLSTIRFEGKDGAAPVPDFALIQMVGCLSRDSGGTWRVERAGGYVRTRNPNDSTSAELQAAAAQPLGNNTFRILDGSSLQPDSHDGRKAKVKGFLIRKPNDDRLNITSVEVVGKVCE